MASILKPSWNLIYDAVWGGGELTCPTGDREKMGRKRGEKRRDKGTAKTAWKEHSERKCWRDAK